VGWGRIPADVNEIVLTDQHAAHIAYQGELRPASWVRMQIPIPRNPSGNLGFSTDSSRGVIRVEVCALHALRPSWLGASEESAPND
jgi:hypothetical protein